MGVTYFPAVITAIEDETPGVRRFFFQPEQAMMFSPGQFVMLNLPINDKFTNRSYSIASEPTDDGIFELCIVLKEDGKGTPHIWENFKVGDKVDTAGPFGKFVLQEPILTDICMIATGTGVAPLRSMVRHIIAKNLNHQDIHLVFGNRFQKDILYKTEFEKLAQEHSWFHFHPVLSREKAENWSGHIGYVHEVYETLFPYPSDTTFYICGWSNMVREARDRLKAVGYGKPQVKYELYD